MTPIPPMSQAEVNRVLGMTAEQFASRSDTPKISPDPGTRQHEQTLRLKIVETVLAYHPQIDTHDLLIKSSTIAGWVINDVLSVVHVTE